VPDAGLSRTISMIRGELEKISDPSDIPEETMVKVRDGLRMAMEYRLYALTETDRMILSEGFNMTGMLYGIVNVSVSAWLFHCALSLDPADVYAMTQLKYLLKDSHPGLAAYYAALAEKAKARGVSE
jgi:hypothetical protein